MIKRTVIEQYKTEEGRVIVIVLVSLVTMLTSLMGGFLLLYIRLFGGLEVVKKKGLCVPWGIYALMAIIIFGIYSSNMAYQWYFNKDMQICPYDGDISGKLAEHCEMRENIYLLTDLYVTSNPLIITRSKWGGLYCNSIYLRTWLIPSPIGLHYARVHGIKNPMRALVDREKTYLCSSDKYVVNMIAEHLSKVTGQPVSFEMVEEGVWRADK